MQVESINDLLENIEDIKNKVSEESKLAEKAEAKAANPKAADVKTRNVLTMTFLWFFFGMLILSCLFVLWYNNNAVQWILELKKNGLDEAAKTIQPLELEKILSIVIGALGTSLGFIIGYYFKEKN